MPARNTPRDPETDLPDQSGCDAKRGEIQALLESPELRRIFDEEPAKFRNRKAGRDRSGGGPEDGGGPSDRARSSRKRRILVGLAPLYLAGVILFFETVREPSMLLEAFGTPSIAEETSQRAGAAVIAAAAPDKALEVGSRQDAAPEEIDGNSTAATAPDAGGPQSTATRIAVADVRPGNAGKSATIEKSAVTEKSATDLAKRAPARPVRDPGTAHRDLPTNDRFASPAIAGAATAPESRSAEGAGEATPVVFASNRPLVGPYPDPRAGAAALPETVDPAAAEAAEQALRLSRGDRREVQRRLRFASADPKAIDGIFGPATRSAIAAWQEKAGLQATGFMDDAAMALLTEQTADDYRAWRTAERARAREREAQSAVVAASAPTVPRASRDDDRCRRIASGEIAFGRDVGCNVKAFGENLRRDFRNLKGDLRGLFH